MQKYFSIYSVLLKKKPQNPFGQRKRDFFLSLTNQLFPSVKAEKCNSAKPNELLIRYPENNMKVINSFTNNMTLHFNSCFSSKLDVCKAEWNLDHNISVLRALFYNEEKDDTTKMYSNKERNSSLLPQISCSSRKNTPNIKPPLLKFFSIPSRMIKKIILP